MKYLKLVVLLIFSFSFSLQAKEAPFQADDVEFLQQSCREVVEIFENKDQSGSYAALHTSMAEAMRAGYCIGVLQQYSKQSHRCYSSGYRSSNWFEMAKTIANISMGKQELRRAQVSKLLKQAYCNG